MKKYILILSTFITCGLYAQSHANETESLKAQEKVDKVVSDEDKFKTAGVGKNSLKEAILLKDELTEQRAKLIKENTDAEKLNKVTNEYIERLKLVIGEEAYGRYIKLYGDQGIFGKVAVAEQNLSSNNTADRKAESKKPAKNNSAPKK